MLIAIVACVTLVVGGVALAITETCTSNPCVGTRNADTLTGTDGSEKIWGEAGADYLYGKGDYDLIKGGYGADYVYGDLGNDRVKGSQGRDHVYGGEGDDLVRGGLHSKADDGVRDVLDCGPGNDTVLYVRGQDTIIDCEIKNPNPNTLP